MTHTRWSLTVLIPMGLSAIHHPRSCGLVSILWESALCCTPGTVRGSDWTRQVTLTIKTVLQAVKKLTGNSNMELSALKCSAFRNPSVRIFRDLLESVEFRGSVCYHRPSICDHSRGNLCHTPLFSCLVIANEVRGGKHIASGCR